MTREEAFKLKVIPTAEKLRLLWERIHELEEKIEELEAERPKGHWITKSRKLLPGLRSKYERR